MVECSGTADNPSCEVLDRLELEEIRESSFNMTGGGGGGEDIETQSLKF